VSGILKDIFGFILAPPATATLVKPSTRADREDLAERIQQRTGVDVTTYSILNVHSIGVNVPGRDVFARLREWDGDSLYWPNHLAQATRVEKGLENIDIRLFGWHRFLGMSIKPLFHLKTVRIREEPDSSETDSARYILFSCEGGYPIGHFFMYVRSSIEALGETEPTQLFMAVGFNVYGRRRLARLGPARFVTAFWELLHNRVTSHVLLRLKNLCEAEFKERVAGR
jgi:hypothetical protein